MIDWRAGTRNRNNFLLASFFQIHNADTFWACTRKYLVPAMYEVKWYNGQAFEYKDGFISDMSGYLVGMPRFRQLRVKPGEYNFIRSQPLHVTVRSIEEVPSTFRWPSHLLKPLPQFHFHFTILEGTTPPLKNFLTLHTPVKIIPKFS